MLCSLRLPPDPLTLDLGEIVRLVAGSNPPKWLHEFLVDYTSTLPLDMAVTARAPTRTLLKKKLDGVRSAAQDLLGALVDGDLWDFVSASGLADAAPRGRLQRQLELLAANAEQHISPLLGRNGKVRAGPGHAFSRDTFSPEVHCAVVIAECWRYARGRYPAPRTRGAQKAADLLWAAAGGERRNHSDDPTESWRPRLKEAVAASVPTQLEEFRSDVRRRLADAEHINATLTGGIPAESGSI